MEETSRITEELESAVNLSDPVAMSNWLKDAGNLFLAGLKEQVIKVDKIKFDFFLKDYHTLVSLYTRHVSCGNCFSALIS